MHEAKPHQNHRSSNRLKGLFGLLCLILWIPIANGCSGDPPTAAKTRPTTSPTRQYEGTIVAMGDSLTAGLGLAEEKAYPAQLSRRLSAAGHRFKVVNAGVSGETSSGALSRVEWVIASLKPDIVILETGANDGLRGIDPALLEANLNRLITVFKAHNIEVILAGMQMLPNLGPDYTRAFKTIYPRIAQQHRIILIPFFLEGVAGRDHLNQPDKIHPTAAGYTRIVDTIFPFVLNAIDSREKNSHK
jgi:acyl-CoA thioesterase-1